jgi:hypothetical protein
MTARDDRKFKETLTEETIQKEEIEVDTNRGNYSERRNRVDTNRGNYSKRRDRCRQ